MLARSIRYAALPLLALLALAVAAAGCGPNACKKACRQLATCQGIDPATLDESGWACPLSDECTPQERCSGECADGATCEALLGQDLVAMAEISRCAAECVAALDSDAGPAAGDARRRDAWKPPTSDATPWTPDQGPCVPRCAGRACGGDGCGGSCGECVGADVCNYNNGSCATVCEPDCTYRACGDDGCGGSCGSCYSPEVCDEDQGVCEIPCTPKCSGRQCGDDGCGGSCGSCSVPKICNTKTHTCELACEPCCAGKQCGDDGCGGSCGSCSYPSTCNAAGQCVTPSTGTTFGGICDPNATATTCDASLGCIGVTLSATDPAPVDGFCTKACTTLGQSCAGGPTGSFASCALEGQDTTGATVYLCVFLCVVEGQSYLCPGGMTCTADPAGSGISVCMP